MNPIAVIPKCTVHVFWKAVEAGAREGAKEAGVEMIWKGSLKEDDPARQIQIVQQLVSEGVGGIVLAPIDDTALRGPVAAAMQKGIPVVIMDSALKGEPLKDFVCTVSTNNQRAGDFQKFTPPEFAVLNKSNQFCKPWLRGDNRSFHDPRKNHSLPARKLPS
jgi:ABC-type sugar transport system substrate-binding protein